LSTQDTAAPKRRSSAANRRRKRRGTVDQPEVQVEEVTATEQPSRAERKAAARPDDAVPAEADELQPKHVRRQQERREAKSREPEKKGGIVGKVVNTERFSGLSQFYRDTRAEIRKVEWPDRQTTINLTVLVIGLSLVLGLILGGIDYVLFQLFEAMT